MEEDIILFTCAFTSYYVSFYTIQVVHITFFYIFPNNGQSFCRSYMYINIIYIYIYTHIHNIYTYVEYIMSHIILIPIPLLILIDYATLEDVVYDDNHCYFVNEKRTTERYTSYSLISAGNANGLN